MVRPYDTVRPGRGRPNLWESNDTMLDSLRRGAGTWVVKIFLGILVLSFAVWGIGDIFRVSPDTAVAEVGEIEISQYEFTDAFNRAVGNLQLQFGGRIDSQQARDMGVADETLRQLVNQALYDQAAKDLGLDVADQVIQREMSTNPAFQGIGGGFDPLAFQSALQNAGISEAYFLQNRRRELSRQQLFDSVTLGGHAPKAMVEALLRHQHQRRSVEVLTLNDGSLPAPDVPGEDVLEAYYKDHVTRYTAPEFRTLTFLDLRPESLLEQVSVTESEVRDAYDARLDEFTIEETREVEQIRVQEEDKANQIKERLVAGGDFIALAKELAGLDEGQVKLGIVRKGDLPGELDDVVQGLAADGISAPVKGPFGWHIFRLTKLTPGRMQTYDEMKKRIEGEIKLERAADALFELSNAVEDSLAGGAGLEEMASELGLTLTKLAAIGADRRGPDGKVIAAIPQAPGFMQKAFSLEVGEEPRLEESDTGAYYAVRVDAIQPPAPRPIAEVRDKVLADWTADARRTAAETRIKELAARAEGGTTFAELASDGGLTVTKREKLDRRQMGQAASVGADVVDQVFTAKKDAVITGEGATATTQVVVRLLEIEDVDLAKSKDEFQALAQGLEQSMTGDLLEQFNRGLEKLHTVEINDRAVALIFDNTQHNYR